MSDNPGSISRRGLAFLETEVDARVANAEWWAAHNAKIAQHAAQLAVHEAAIQATLAEMAEQHIADAAFNARWNAMSYREAVAFQQGRGL